MKRQLNIEVVYAEPHRQALVEINVPEGSTVAEAIASSGLAEQFPDVNFANAEFGVWGQHVDAARVLQDGDRVEIYRPLVMDPRDARRRLATLGRAMGQKGPTSG